MAAKKPFLPPAAPTHNIRVIVREGAGVPGVPAGRYATIGVGWLNDDLSMNIQLHPGMALRWDDGLQITAFLRNEKDKDKDE